MKTLLLANNRTGLGAIPILRESGFDLAGLVVHPPDRSRFRDEILRAAGLPADRLFSGDQLRDAETRARIAALGCEWALSVNFGYLLRSEFLQLFPRGVGNLHPSLLPHGRGACPNVWAIVDGHPAGVTLHQIDEGVDTGAIIAQQEVPLTAWDTGASLYDRLHHAVLDLLRTSLPDLNAGRCTPHPQPAAGRTYRVQDLRAIDDIDLDARYTARELINILRARTFPPYDGAYFRDAEGRKVHLRLQLTPEDCVETAQHTASTAACESP